VKIFPRKPRRGGTDVDNSTEESDDETIDHTLVNLKQPRPGSPALVLKEKIS
jgi:hypothetical protein